MKKGYLIGLFAGCTLLMMGCSNQQKDSVTDPDTPAVTDNTDITEGEAEVAGQDSNMDTATATGNGQSDDAGNSTTVGSGQDDASGNAAVDDAGDADTTGSPAVSAGKKSTTTSKNSSNNTETQNKKQTSSSSQTKDIGMEAAKKIALGKAGLTEQDGSWKEEKRDKENGQIVYELEFVSGNVEYEFEINAQDGKILEYKQDPIDD